MRSSETKKGQGSEFENVRNLRKRVEVDLQTFVPLCPSGRCGWVSLLSWPWWSRLCADWTEAGFESKIRMTRFTTEAWRAARQKETMLFTAALVLRRSLPADVVGIIVYLVAAR